MLKKGIINESMDEEEMQEFIKTGGESIGNPPKGGKEAHNQPKRVVAAKKKEGKHHQVIEGDTNSEVTVYKRAVVQQDIPNGAFRSN